ncbi:polyphosphate kinase 1 [Rubritalea tangerina]|uniref:Polyphosphate kinase n=1 Tax=Rubritalea tangerina TaxID=430798 RepID=A0ABW4ZCB4_9BACT
MPSNYINRELSWIEFNQRVLSEGQRHDKALLERLKFLAISASNMDEFFQVRVGGLTLLKSAGSRKKDIAGMTPTQQLTAIRKRIKTQVSEQYTLLNEELLPELEHNGIKISTPKKLPKHIKEQVFQRFEDNIFPLLTPLSCQEVDETHPALTLPAMTLVVACLMRDENLSERLALIPITESVDRFIQVEDLGIQYVIPVEDAIASFAGTIFPGESIRAHTVFRITRNGDIAVQEEDAIDLAGEMEEVLSARKTSNTVRVEMSATGSRLLEKEVLNLAQAKSDQIFRINGPLCLSDFMQLAFISGFEDLKAPSWEPQPSTSIDFQNSIFDEISKNDILLYHPYHSFDPVLRLLEEAASDEQVLAIKQVLYRTAKHSRIIDALIRAAENGKQVTVLVEIKARFDEARNLHRAEELQKAGVQIVYGVKGLKTHAKITLVVRKETSGLRRYCHLGTGNYNESTARLYTDVSLLTAKSSFGADASLVFNAITGRSKLLQPRHILPAPTHMKKRLLELIASEASRAKSGEKAFITAKVNSLQDKDIIDALYKASKAGVKIKLNIRGICCLKTGSRKEAKNIEVVSVIDYYLEHARIFQFHQGGDNLLFISSADWMTRNLEKRVELMVPIIDKNLKSQLIDILEAAFKDNQQAHRILEDGSSSRITPKGKNSAFRMQEYLQKKAAKAAKAKSYMRTTTFEPHTPTEED